MKKATAYKHGDSLYVHALSKTTAGIWMLSQPVVSCSVSEDAVVVGRHLTDALNGSRENIPHPSSWKGVFDPVLQLAGIKSISTFNKAAKCVDIESDGAEAALVPTRNLGPDDGFEPISGLAQRASLNDPLKLGTALLKALEDAH
jgi:hypothetical protein